MKNKIKLILAINSFNIGGAEKLIVDQLRFFDREKFDISLITLFQFQDRKNFYELLPKDINIYKLNFKNFYDLKSWLFLYKLLKKISPNIIVSSLFFSNTIFRILAIIFKIKVIIIEHNTYINKTKAHQFVDKILSYFTYKIIAVSDEVANFTSKQEKIEINKFKIIYNGIDLEKINKFKEINKNNILGLKEKLGFGNSDKIIINVARLTNQKRIDLLIDAFAKLHKIDNKYKLIILGEGTLLFELQNQINSLGLKDSAFLLGIKKNIYEYYMISDLFVLTSKIEGFALVCIEAMTFEVPVVSTKVAGPDKYVKDYFNGFLVEHDMEDIFKKMVVFFDLDDQELDKYKQNCLNTAKQFDIKNNVKEYEKLLIESLEI